MAVVSDIRMCCPYVSREPSRANDGISSLFSTVVFAGFSAEYCFHISRYPFLLRSDILIHTCLNFLCDWVDFLAYHHGPQLLYCISMMGFLSFLVTKGFTS